MSKWSSGLQLRSVLTLPYFFFLGWFYSLLATLFSRNPRTFAFLTSWLLQPYPDFKFTASCNDLPFRHSFSDIPDTCQASVALSPNSFLLSLTLKPESSGQSCQVLLLTRVGTWPSQLHHHYLFVFPCLSFVFLKLAFLYLTGIKLRDLPASAFPVLGLKMCPITPSSKFSSTFFSLVGNVPG